MSALWFPSILFALAALHAPLASTAGEETKPQEMVRVVMDDMTHILQAVDLRSAQKRERVETLLEARLNTRLVVQMVMARNWKKMTAEEQDRLEVLFGKHLVLTYWGYAEDADLARIDIVGDREEARGDWTVKTSIVQEGGKEPIFLDYRLRKATVDGEKKGPWKIIDIIVESMSMVSNFRSQFGEVFSKGGATKLLDALEKKNAELLGAEKTPEQG